MKKEWVTLAILCVILLSGCGSAKEEIHTQNKSEPASQPVTIASQPEKNFSGERIEMTKDEKVKLYASKQTDHMIEGVTLDVNGVFKEFNWKIPNTGTKPQLLYTDLTGDGKEEVVVMIQTGRGTGLDHFDIHVINTDDLSEMKVQDYQDIVDNHIESHVTNTSNGIEVTVTTQGKESKFEHTSAIAAPDQKELAFGGVIMYTIENQTIKLNLPGSVGVSPTYVCDFNVTYQYDRTNHQFIVDQIEVEPLIK